MDPDEPTGLTHFLSAIAPEVVNLLRAVADYLDPTLEDFGPDPESDGYPPPVVPQRVRIDERGAMVPISPSEG